MDALSLKPVELCVGLLALWAVVFTGGQLRVVSIDARVQEGQLTAAAERLTAVREAREQTDLALSGREKQLLASAQQETRYAALLTELLELAKADPDARLITQKWKIQSSAEAVAGQQNLTGTPVPAGERGSKAAPAGAAAPTVRNP